MNEWKPTIPTNISLKKKNLEKPAINHKEEKNSFQFVNHKL